MAVLQEVTEQLPIICRVGGGHAGYDAGLLRGLHAYVRPDKRWIIHDLARMGPDQQQLAYALRLKPSVLIVHAWSREFESWLKPFRCPVINVSHVDETLPFLRLGPDELAVGTMAAEYFLARGYRRFGFVGHQGWAATKGRLQGFRSRLERQGLEVTLLPSPMAADPREAEAQFRTAMAALRQLRAPAAVFTDTDTVARGVCECARQAGVRVPEDLAVLGCDNYELVCELCWPPLSSVQTPGYRAGFELGKLIEQVLSGGSLPAKPVLFGPEAVVTRRSTDTVAVDNEHVAQALRLIHARFASGVTVKELLRVVPISRVQLFMLFKRHLGRSPQEEIFRVRLDAVKALLANTDLSMTQIASKCGLRDAIHLMKFFKSETGLTPTAYRRSQRITPGDAKSRR